MLCVDIFDWDEVDRSELRAEDGELVDLAVVGALANPGIPMVGVRAGRPKDHTSVSEAARLALDARKACPVVDDQVGPGILAEGRVDRIPLGVKGEHDRQGRLVTDVLGMPHSSSVRVVSDRPCPKQTTRGPL